MAEKLEIIIAAKDSTQETFRNFSDVLNEMTETVIEQATIGMINLGKGLLDLVPMAFEAELAQTNLEQVIRSTGMAAGITAEEAMWMADAFSRATRFSDEQVASAEGLLLTFTKIGGDVMPRATETVLDMAEKFGSLEGSAIQLGKALNDPVAGVSALREVGVSFTEEQADMIKQMVEAGDIAGAQAVILDELAVEVGGLAQAYGNTNQGKVARFQNRLEDVGQYIGSFFIGYIGDLAGNLTYVIELFQDAGFYSSEMYEGFQLILGQNLGKEVYNIVESLSRMVDILWSMGPAGVTTLQFWVELNELFGSQLGNTIHEITMVLYDLWIQFDSLLQRVIVPFISEHADTFIAIFAKFGAVLAGGAIVSGLLAIGSALVGIIFAINPVMLAIVALVTAYQTNFLGMKDAVDAFAGWFVKTAMPAIRDFIVDKAIPALSSLYDTIKDKWEETKPLLELLRVWFVVEALPAIKDFIINTAAPAIVSLMETVQDLWTKAEPYLSKLADWFFTSALPSIVDFVTNTVIPLVLDFISLLSDIWRVVQPFLSDLFNWFMNTGLPWVVDYVIGPAWDAFNSLINIISDIWRVAWPLLQTFINTLWNQFNSLRTNVLQPMWDLFNNIINTVNNLINRINSLTSISINTPFGNVHFGTGGILQGFGYTGDTGEELVYAPGGAVVFPPDITRALKNLGNGGNNYNLTYNDSSVNNVRDDFRMMEVLANG